MTMNTDAGARPIGALLTAVILGLTATTAYIHLTLGGTIFVLNGLGYIGLAVAYGLAATSMPIARRFGWLPRIGLAGYALLTIGAYLAIGPYFGLGWIAKAIEAAIIGLVIVDLLRLHGSPDGLIKAVRHSLRLMDPGGARW